MKRTFYQSRASICPECHRILAADHIQDELGLHLKKYCPDHGYFSTRIAADHGWLNGLLQYSARSTAPGSRQTKISMGCPADCGECEGHLQKSAFFLFEITNACNLKCPICLGRPKESGYFISLAEMESMTRTVLEYAGPGPIITLGGGEPTLHPDFFDLVHIIKQFGVEDIWVYTNGLKLAKDPDFVQRIADENLYVVLQWDCFDDAAYKILRQKSLMAEKQMALENLKESGVKIGLCPTVVAGVNDQDLGRIYDMFVKDPQIVTLDIATMAFVGKGSSFEAGKQPRITAQDVLTCLEDQTIGKIRLSDFSPVSFSHPECLQISYHFATSDGDFVPLKRFLDPKDYQNLVSNKPLLDLTAELEDVFRDVINRLWADGKDDPDAQRGLNAMRHVVKNLFPSKRPLHPVDIKAKSRDLVKVVLVHSYMDGLNFDVGRTKMCISRTVLPDGRMMPTCAYNVMHRGKSSQ